MHRRPVRTLIVGLLAALWLGPGPARADPATYISTYVWTSEDKTFAGWSGLEVAANGRDFTALSDHGIWMDGEIERGPDGIITGVEAGKIHRIRTASGTIGADSEGLAIAPDGTTYVSFEIDARIERLDRTGGQDMLMTRNAAFAFMQGNAALEALAVDADGALYTLPERSGNVSVAFPVYRLRNGTWDQPFAIARRGKYLATGADFGPDGRLYLLERRFHGILGFSSRVRSFAVTETGTGDERIEFESATGQHDNLEGIAVWRDADGDIRLTMVSDDNNFFLQQTQLVEYRIPR